MFQYFKKSVVAAARSAAIEAVKNVARKFAMVLQFRSKQAPVNALGTRQNALSAKISEWMDTMAPDWMKQVMPKARIGLLSAAILAGAYANKGCEELIPGEEEEIEEPGEPGWNPETGFCKGEFFSEDPERYIRDFFSHCMAHSYQQHRIAAIAKVGANVHDSVLFDAIRKEHFACLANYINEHLKGNSLNMEGYMYQGDMKLHSFWKLNDHGRPVGGALREIQIGLSKDTLAKTRIIPARTFVPENTYEHRTDFAVEKD